MTMTKQNIEETILGVLNKYNRTIITYINTNILLTKSILYKDIINLTYEIDIKRNSIKFIGVLNHLDKINVVIRDKKTVKPIFYELKKEGIDFENNQHKLLNILESKDGIISIKIK